MNKNLKLFQRRKTRNRFKLSRSLKGKLRLSVHKTAQHIYVQLIDDQKGITLASSSSLDKELNIVTRANKEVAGKVGVSIAKRVLDLGIKEVVFDRGGYLYHGRIKALADAAREEGLVF